MGDLVHKAPPKYSEWSVKHFRQQFNWDCGIACVLMALPERERQYFLSNFKKICENEGFNHSTWTIDLCYLLRRFNVMHNYYTTTIGVDPRYKDHAYYENLMGKDEVRINHKFTSANSDKIIIKRASLTIGDIISHLIYNGPIIMLINANLLVCNICKVNKISLDLRSCFPWPIQYFGHFIILCGYNSEKNKILYRNPTFKERVCSITCHSLDVARKSYGTDEDTILIFNDKSSDRNQIVYW